MVLSEHCTWSLVKISIKFPLIPRNNIDSLKLGQQRTRQKRNPMFSVLICNSLVLWSCKRYPIFVYLYIWACMIIFHFSLQRCYIGYNRWHKCFGRWGQTTKAISPKSWFWHLSKFNRLTSLNHTQEIAYHLSALGFKRAPVISSQNIVFKTCWRWSVSRAW